MEAERQKTKMKSTAESGSRKKDSESKNNASTKKSSNKKLASCKQHRPEPPFSLYKNPERSPSTFQEGFASVIDILRKSKNIVVLTGAGISVSCGIPDFRTQGSGLYSTLDFEELGLSCAEELFDWDVFQDNPVPFFKFARNLYFPLLGKKSNRTNGNDGETKTTTAAVVTTRSQHQRVRPSDSHKLLALLEQKKKLLRVYSQNIDGLEQQAGVSSKKVVYAHGSLQWATCLKCKRRVPSSDIEADILAGNVAYCQAPVASNNKNGNRSRSNSHDHTLASSLLPTTHTQQSTLESPSTTRNHRSNNKRPRTHMTRARSDSSSHDNNSNSCSGGSSSNNNNNKNENVCGGVLKPGVTFFGEPLKDNVGKSLESDHDKVDALIVIGTSLSVAPISKVIHYLPPNIPRILINRTIVHPSEPLTVASSDDDDNSDEEEEEDFRQDYVFDAYLLGYCDDVTRALAQHLFFTPVNETPPEFEPGRLVANLMMDEKKEDKEEDVESASPYKAQDWDSITVPKDRVFLFPGATPHNDTALSSSSLPQHNGTATVETTPQFREIAHCDGCSKRIVGMIQKCVVCFDYDLCSDCFPSVSKTHHDGKHVFCAEPAAAPSSSPSSRLLPRAKKR